MGLQFILGNAGGGKTWYIEHQAAAMASKDMKRQIFVVVPEQFTMQTQRNLVALSERHGLWNIEVQSFPRLAFRVFGETGAGMAPVIDDLGKTMILKKVLMGLQDQLTYFGRNIHKKGYVAEIKSFLSELMQYDIASDGLEQMKESAKSHPVLRQKLQDVEVAYAAFLDYLQDNYITSEEILTVFADVAERSNILKDSILYLDGFTGFTPVQYKLLRKLLRVCGQVNVTVTLDKREQVWKMDKKYKLFYLSQKTIYHLTEIAREEHCDIAEPIWTGTVKEETRFADNVELGYLERNLFRYPVRPYKEEVQNITVHCLRQPEDEVHFMIEEIMALREQESFRYRDVAIVTGNMDIYGTLIKGEMERKGMPCFIDQKKSILANPVVDTISSMLDVLRKDFDYESMIKLLKSGFIQRTWCPTNGIKEWENAVQLLDNFLLASGVRGHKNWEKEWDTGYVFRRKAEDIATEASETINWLRQETWDRLSDFYGRIARGKHRVREYAETICDFMEREQIYLQIQKRIERFREEGNFEAVKEYEQIYDVIIEVLDRLVALLGDEEMPLAEFIEILNTGFDEARIGLIPPGVDQIMVGDLSRTRLYGIKYLFLLGVNDGNIPMTGDGGGILSDAEREFLAGESYALAPTAREKIYTEQFYLYLCLTKPSQRLYLTYSATANDGTALQQAYLIDRVQNIFPKLQIQNVAESRGRLRDILRDDYGRGYLIRGLRMGWQDNAAWNELYRQYRLQEQELACAPKDGQKKMLNHRGELDRLIDAALYIAPESKISKEAATALYHEVITGSVSQFEKFSACPFAYYMQYGLQLEERMEHEVQFFDIGNIVHEALERYTKTLLDRNIGWADVSEEQQHILANQCLNHTVEEYKNGLLYDTERDASLVERLRRIMLRTVWAITEQMKLGKFDTVDSEVSFRMDKEKQTYIGRVDRIDTMETEENIYVKIVDYKTGKKDLSLSDLYYGLQLQLMVYLRAAVDKQTRRSKKMVIPAGVLYYHIEDPFVTSRLDFEEKRTYLLNELLMRGLVNEEDPVLPSLDATLAGEEGALAASAKSLVVPVGTKKDGMLKKNAATITTENFKELIDFTERKLQEIGVQIGAGETSMHPYQKADSMKSCACDYCNYHGICGFDAKLAGNSYRKIWPKTNDDVFSEIRRESDIPSEDRKGNEVNDVVPSEDRKGNEVNDVVPSEDRNENEVNDVVPSEDRKGNEASGKEETR